MTGGSSLANPIYLFRGDAPREDFAKAMPFLGKVGFKLAGKKFMPSYPFEEAYFREKALMVRGAVDMPLVFLGGINNLSTVQQAMADGDDKRADQLIVHALMEGPSTRAQIEAERAELTDDE